MTKKHAVKTIGFKKTKFYKKIKENVDDKEYQLKLLGEIEYELFKIFKDVDKKDVGVALDIRKIKEILNTKYLILNKVYGLDEIINSIIQELKLKYALKGKFTIDLHEGVIICP